jgi:hypothetical protein
MRHVICPMQLRNLSSQKLPTILKGIGFNIIINLNFSFNGKGLKGQQLKVIE